jgi:hypothetical protein
VLRLGIIKSVNILPVINTHFRDPIISVFFILAFEPKANQHHVYLFFFQDFSSIIQGYPTTLLQLFYFVCENHYVLFAFRLFEFLSCTFNGLAYSYLLVFVSLQFFKLIF